MCLEEYMTFLIPLTVGILKDFQTLFERLYYA